MKSRQTLKDLGRKKYLAVAIPLIMAAQAQSLEFYSNGIEGSINSQISIGSSWRLEQPDSVITADPTINGGDTNYEKNDAFSQIFKGSHDLNVSYKNYGAFVRGKYWYDAALENDDDVDDSGYHDLAKFSGAEVLDAFVYGEFEVMDMPLDLRLGKQVLSWGESTFIQGGINSINPFDVSSFRRPGAEVKEGLIPINMAFANLGLTENLSAEAFYLLEFHETVLEGCDTYFSDNDYAGQGCGKITIDEAAGLEIRRDDNDLRKPSSDGQFGIAFRYLSEALDTEFGFYAMNIHSQVPIVSGAKATVDEAAVVASGVAAAFGISDADLITAMEVQGDITGGFFPGTSGNTFYVEYPEDIQITGLSFATNIATMSVSGEISHKQNVPMQINSTQAVSASLTSDYLVGLGVTDPFLTEIAAIEDGTDIDTYRSFDVSQAQITAIKLFDQVLGANRYAVVAEAGYTFVHSLDDSADADIKFGGVAVSANADGTYNYTNTVTQRSWGYTTRIVGEYSDVFYGVNITPVLSWSQDMKGFSPRPGGAFREGSERLGFTLNADYQDTYTAAISYSKLSGDVYDFVSDRDFASVTIGMQF